MPKELTAVVAGRSILLDAARVELVARTLEPERIQTYSVTIAGRRFPPKQILAAVTGLDRGDFISTQARSILQRLGFPVARRREVGMPPDEPPARHLRADLLRPHRGRWVAVDWGWTEVLVAADNPLEVVAALRARGVKGTVIGVPLDPTVDIGGWAS